MLILGLLCMIPCERKIFTSIILVFRQINILFIKIRVKYPFCLSYVRLENESTPSSSCWYLFFKFEFWVQKGKELRKHKKGLTQRIKIAHKGIEIKFKGVKIKRKGLTKGLCKKRTFTFFWKVARSVISWTVKRGPSQTITTILSLGHLSSIQVPITFITVYRSCINRERVSV